MNPTQIIEQILAAKKVDDVVVMVRRASGVNLRWASNTTTTNGATDGWELAISTIDDGRVATLARDLTGGEDPVEILRDVESGCGGKPEAFDRMPLPEGDGSDPDGWLDESIVADPGSIDAFGIATVFAAAKRDDVLTYGFAEHEVSDTWFATSAGIRRRDRQERGHLDFTGKSGDLVRSTWAGTFSGRASAAELYEGVKQRLAWSERRIDLPAGRYEVILSPSCVADMLQYMLWLAAFRDANEGHSAFSKPGGGTKLGEKLFETPVTLASDPTEPVISTMPFVAAFTSSSFSSVFDAGAPKPRVEWIGDGVLTNLVAPRKIAADAGVAPALNGGNIIMEGDGPTLDAMVAGTERALLLNALWYIRLVDPQTMLLTGLTRDGVYLVEDGKVTGEVNNFRYNVSPLDMLANIREIGKSAVSYAREFEAALPRTPPLRVADWFMSSVSDAT